jgi:hypothetical protein
MQLRECFALPGLRGALLSGRMRDRVDCGMDLPAVLVGLRRKRRKLANLRGAVAQNHRLVGAVPGIGAYRLGDHGGERIDKERLECRVGCCAVRRRFSHLFDDERQRGGRIGMSKRYP